MEKAKKKLQREQKSCHLLRYSENRGAFTLTVYRVIKDEEEKEEEEGEFVREVFLNFNILITKRDGHITWEISGTEKKFSEISKMLAFYKKAALHPLVDSIGEECTNGGPQKKGEHSNSTSTHHNFFKSFRI